MHGAAIELLDALHRGQLVLHAGGEQNLAAAMTPFIGGAHAEPAACLDDRLDLTAQETHVAVACQAFLRDLEEAGRGDAIAGKVTVQLVRAAVALLSLVNDEHSPPASPKQQGGAESRRTATDHDGVPCIGVHPRLRSTLSPTASRIRMLGSIRPPPTLAREDTHVAV